MKVNWNHYSRIFAESLSHLNQMRFENVASKKGEKLSDKGAVVGNSDTIMVFYVYSQYTKIIGF